LIAEAEGRPVGWVHAATSEFVEAECFVVIGGLVVDRGRRRQGIGKALMRAAEDWARSQGCSIVRLRTSAGRTAAHRFYEQLGYTNVKKYSFVKSLDDSGQEQVKRFAPRIEE
jgi:(aminoalkyl)phosphonate N-acetyltransferase